MGAWGPGAFENDTALDFAAEIRTAQDLADALTIRTPDQPIDAEAIREDRAGGELGQLCRRMDRSTQQSFERILRRLRGRQIRIARRVCDVVGHDTRSCSLARARARNS